ncbi:hypothetical protein BGW80DRAFT_865784 [Lactifluus volemus]|nr:hypothetical protein BGW80DRAFT_865784 [Lactifluus volemus]
MEVRGLSRSLVCICLLQYIYIFPGNEVIFFLAMQVHSISYLAVRLSIFGTREGIVLIRLLLTLTTKTTIAKDFESQRRGQMDRVVLITGRTIHRIN